jgi:hypothetical protein
MRRVAISLAALVLLGGCEQELSKEKVELYAAVAYVTWGMEEGNDKFSAERVERKVLSDGVAYTVYSKKDGPPGMVFTVKSPKECVFTLGGLHTDGMLYTLDFNKATKFKFDESNFLAYTELEGPQVYCEGKECKDEHGFMMLEQRGSIDLPENRLIARRKYRAIDLIRKSCPGKPF